ncbi:hypothetical protein HPB49_026554 [Dermacentor silvarum]|nr:hypothetical protein HPB49_026554 [Dermacentor silvarum]
MSCGRRPATVKCLLIYARCLVTRRYRVLDAGRIMEFDEPYELMKNEFSQFTTMVQHTGPSMARQLWKVACQAHAQRRQPSDHEGHGPEIECIEELPPWFVPSRPDVVTSGRTTEVIQEEDGDTEDGQCYTSL